MPYDIRPLSDTLGAEIIGLDLAQPLDDATFAAVRQAHLDHLVLVFRDQRLSPQNQVAFSSRFGPLDRHPVTDAVLPDCPDVLVLSTKRKNGAFIGLPDAGPMWHSDLAYREHPALGTMLYALETPDYGGDTGFANMYKACEALPKHLADAVAGKRAVFLAGRNNKNRSFRKGLTKVEKDETPAVTHPIIRTHPETGRQSIFASPQHAVAIEGLDERESSEILTALFDHTAQPDFIYHHKWRVGDLTFWDNRCVQHIADLSRIDDPAYIRHMHRTTIGGGPVE
ncbi:MAG: TauD/TfdA family dioxygenase [Alphaproteobacteria bacterium]|nr:TauD/TfdA family dioxygenase [Alphaproteobacteria bacterium]